MTHRAYLKDLIDCDKLAEVFEYLAEINAKNLGIIMIEKVFLQGERGLHDRLKAALRTIESLEEEMPAIEVKRIEITKNQETMNNQFDGLNQADAIVKAIQMLNAWQNDISKKPKTLQPFIDIFETLRVKKQVSFKPVTAKESELRANFTLTGYDLEKYIDSTIKSCLTLLNDVHETLKEVIGSLETVAVAKSRLDADLSKENLIKYIDALLRKYESNKEQLSKIKIYQFVIILSHF